MKRTKRTPTGNKFGKGERLFSVESEAGGGDDDDDEDGDGCCLCQHAPSALLLLHHLHRYEQGWKRVISHIFISSASGIALIQFVATFSNSFEKCHTTKQMKLISFFFFFFVLTQFQFFFTV